MTTLTSRMHILKTKTFLIQVSLNRGATDSFKMIDSTHFISTNVYGHLTSYEKEYDGYTELLGQLNSFALRTMFICNNLKCVSYYFKSIYQVYYTTHTHTHTCQHHVDYEMFVNKYIKKEVRLLQSNNNISTMVSAQKLVL